MHKMSCFIKGTLVGFAVGAAVGVMTDPLSDRERRKISKKTEGIFRNIGSVMDNIIDIFHIVHRNIFCSWNNNYISSFISFFYLS